MSLHEWWRRVEPWFLADGNVACYLGPRYTLMFWLVH